MADFNNVCVFYDKWSNKSQAINITPVFFLTCKMCFDECLDSFDSYWNETNSFVYSWCWSSRDFQMDQTSVGALMILLSGNKDLRVSVL